MHFPHTERIDEGHSPAGNVDGPVMHNPFSVRAQMFDKLFQKKGRDMRLDPSWGQARVTGRRKETRREVERTVRWPLRDNRRLA